MDNLTRSLNNLCIYLFLTNATILLNKTHMHIIIHIQFVNKLFTHGEISWIFDIKGKNEGFFAN